MAIRYIRSTPPLPHQGLVSKDRQTERKEGGGRRRDGERRGKEGRKGEGKGGEGRKEGEKRKERRTRHAM